MVTIDGVLIPDFILGFYIPEFDAFKETINVFLRLNMSGSLIANVCLRLEFRPEQRRAQREWWMHVKI